MPNPDVIVIGAGAAGLLAAIRSAERGRRTLLLEKNTKPGVKILMSGGTRCNLTHATDRAGIVDAYTQTCGRRASFLHSPLAAFGPDELVELFHNEGVPTKTEATGKIFPSSDRALDVQRALLRRLDRSGAELKLSHGVSSIQCTEGGFRVATSAGDYCSTSLIVTTGGQSYPGCGTTGDGYSWAKAMGHRIVPPRPALVPLLSDAAWVRDLQGVTLPDVGMGIGVAGSKPELAKRGSLLMTHFGLSGPLPMDLSRIVTRRPDADDWVATCDFVPTIDDGLLLTELTGGSCNVSTVIAKWLPRRASDALLGLVRIDPAHRTAELGKKQARIIIDTLKRCPIPITGTQGFKKAEVTAGGIDLKEIDSRTTESKLVPNLYFAGEILDLDGPIGGYNFQAAFSTGWLAGESVA